MALLDQFFVTPKPGWMTRLRGRPYVETCLLAFDIVAEGLYQARLSLLGPDPIPDSLGYMARDRGIVPGLLELPARYAVRLRRWLWSARASGLVGVPNAILDTAIGSWSGRFPHTVNGTPTEAGVQILVVNGGTTGIVGITYSVSDDGGLSFSMPTALGTNTSITIGNITFTFDAGDTWTAADLLIVKHGGFGLVLNDLGAPSRLSIASGSQAGPEGLLQELANIFWPDPPRMRTASANGTWFTRETDGTLWRLDNGPWAWEAELDADPTYFARGLIVIYPNADIEPWEPVGSETHQLGEPNAAFGHTAGMNWWNTVQTTVSNFKPGNVRVLSVILCFDPTKLDPTVPSTCPQDDWYIPHKYDSIGNVTNSRPLEYAWFSAEM